jgi:hypothetical protein
MSLSIYFSDCANVLHTCFEINWQICLKCHPNFKWYFSLKPCEEDNKPPKKLGPHFGLFPRYEIREHSSTQKECTFCGAYVCKHNTNGAITTKIMPDNPIFTKYLKLINKNGY